MNLNVIKQTLLKLDKKKAIRFIVLFGSFSKGKQTPLSDVDIAVYYDTQQKDRFAFRVLAAGELANKVDVQIFQDLPLTVKKEVLSGKPLYYDDVRFMIDQYVKVIKEFGRFEKYYRYTMDRLHNEVEVA